ncbi:serine/threonine-protein kinase 40 isoform 3-T7 [Macrochelys suwanniensis]
MVDAELQQLRMKRRASDRGAGETSAKAKALCTGISGNNAKRAGPFILGPRLGNSPVPSIVQCLARKDGTDDFYQLKILTLEERGDKGIETQEERQGKMLLHTEYSLLSLLHNQDGVVHHHGLFQDRTCEIIEDLETNRMVRKMRKRICLVLDCLCAHDFSDKTADLINLQHYVIKEKRLSERETVVIFYDVVRVVEALHKKNIVHRDLKLGNMVLNKRTHRITITNFCLGKHLVSEDDLLKDQRGSPAYISPDVLSGGSKTCRDRLHSLAMVCVVPIGRHLLVLPARLKSLLPGFVLPGWGQRPIRDSREVEIKELSGVHPGVSASHGCLTACVQALTLRYSRLLEISGPFDLLPSRVCFKALSLSGATSEISSTVAG